MTKNNKYSIFCRSPISLYNTLYSYSLLLLGQCFKLSPSGHVRLALLFLVFMLLLTNTRCGDSVFSLLGRPL